MKILGVARGELKSRYERYLIEQSMSARNKLAKSAERDKDLLRIVTGTGSVPGAWKDLLRIAKLGHRDAAYDRAR